jgi:DNA-binding FadR family transcriptional regulator
MTKNRRLYRAVLDEMLRMIDAGAYPVGGRLPPERELAQRFNVSRPTIREAVIALEALGRVQVKTGSGIYVLEQRPASGVGIAGVSPYELTEARALVESEAAALAASLITQEELDQLEESLREMAAENDHGDLASGEADQKFHRIISQATRNAMLVSVIENLWHVRNNAPQVFRAYKSICELDGATRIEEHRQIYDALVKRDADAARTAMHEHFARILNKLILTSEAEQIAKARQQAEEVRRRFSRGRFATDA